MARRRRITVANFLRRVHSFIFDVAAISEITISSESIFLELRNDIYGSPELLVLYNCDGAAPLHNIKILSVPMGESIPPVGFYLGTVTFDGRTYQCFTDRNSYGNFLHPERGLHYLTRDNVPMEGW